MLADITHLDENGDLMARPCQWDASSHGPIPLIHILGPAAGQDGYKGGKDSHKGGKVGVRALIRIATSGEDSGGANDPKQLNGHIVKILQNVSRSQIGLIKRGMDGKAELCPIEPGRDAYHLPQSQARALHDGELVEYTSAGRRAGRYGQVKIVRSLAQTERGNLACQIALHRHLIRHEFPGEVLHAAQAASIDISDISGREDWRHLAFLTIDPQDAKDRDDAVHAQKDEGADNPGGHIISVAIADIAHFVPAGSALDQEARLRGNSVYLPGLTIPMLPPRLSDDLCSLAEKEDRLAMIVEMRFSPMGQKLSHRFVRAVIRVAKNLSYEDAEFAVFKTAPDKSVPDSNNICSDGLDTRLAALGAAHKALLHMRQMRQPLELEVKEHKLRLNSEGQVCAIEVSKSLESHRLIEEMMIQANICCAESLEQAKRQPIYRVHDRAATDSYNSLRSFLAKIKYHLPVSKKPQTKYFNTVLRQASGLPEAEIVSDVVLRAQAQAQYSPHNIGHFGLNLARYAHFTSPIRRYADLVAHRTLTDMLCAAPLGEKDDHDQPLADLCVHLSRSERSATAAERDAISRLSAEFLSSRIGEVFNARISGIHRMGLFIELRESGSDGFIPKSTISEDYLRYDEAERALVGRGKNQLYRIGDRLEARLVSADAISGGMRFKLERHYPFRPSLKARGRNTPK